MEHPNKVRVSYGEVVCTVEHPLQSNSPIHVTYCRCGQRIQYADFQSSVEALGWLRQKLGDETWERLKGILAGSLPQSDAVPG